VAKTPQYFSKIAVSYRKGLCDSGNNRQTLLVILHVPPSLGRGNSLINSPTELQYLLLTLIFKASARTCVSSAFFQNLSCNEFFKYRSVHINECVVFITDLSVCVVNFMLTVVHITVFPMCIVGAIEFTLVCFWIELRQLLVRQKYYFLGSLY
jgi:hypothetical protein